MKTAFIFPGQGAQYVGMGKDFAQNFAAARHTFEEADDLLKRNLSSILFEGPGELLTQTKHSQPAIFVVSVAILRSLEMSSSVCAGLSLGEYSALFASKRLSFAETLMLVQKRANLMHAACETTAGSMAAILGMQEGLIEEILKPFKDVWVANYNAPGQTVISGSKEGVVQAIEALKQGGARRCIPLNVHGAFHSGLMESARVELLEHIERAPLMDSPIGLVMNYTGGFVEDLSEIKKNLSLQVTGSVRWQQGIEAMKNAGVETFVEIGCGKTLAGLNKKMDAKTISIEFVADLEMLNAIA